jgi:hypothetical protein
MPPFKQRRFPNFPAGSSHFPPSFILGFFRLTQRRTPKPNTEEEEKIGRRRKRRGRKRRKRRRKEEAKMAKEFHIICAQLKRSG